MHVIGKWEDWW